MQKAKINSKIIKILKEGLIMKKQTAGRENLGELAPKFTELNDDVLFGEGWYQEEGIEAVSLKPGMVITIPANVKHWHGAKKNSWFRHIAVEVPGANTSNKWCEKVTDEEYEKLPE